MLLLLTLSSASALTSRQNGPALDFFAGLGVRGAPARPTGGGLLGLGWWVGTYDDQYSFGKYWQFGATTRVDWRPESLGLTPMFEIRRGLELIVVGISPFVAGGVTLGVPLDETVAPPLGFTARTGVGVKLRRSRTWGISARLEGGVDVVGGIPAAAGGVLFGGSFARPAKPFHAPEI